MSKVIVITGAGVGLGRALARRFAREGHQVVLLGRTLSKVEAAAAEIGKAAMAVACDVGSPESVRQAFATIAGRHPRVDVLINNAAIFQPFQIADASDEQIMQIVNTNLSGPMLCTREALRLMDRGAHIINVGSESVDLPFPHLIAYQSTKAGLDRFSVNLYHELEPRGIRVTMIRAGSMYEEGKAWEVDPEAAKAFHLAALANGLDLRKRPISHFDSVTDAFVAVLNLPADLHAARVDLHAYVAN